MSVMSELDWEREVLDAVRRALPEPEPEPGQTPEEKMEAKCDWIIRELDELCVMANDPMRLDLVDSQRIAIGQMKTRVDLIISFLLAKTPPSFRIVR